MVIHMTKEQMYTRGGILDEQMDTGFSAAGLADAAGRIVRYSVPTLRDRELMLVRRAGYDPQPGDVVVLRKAFRDVTGPIVKRVIAVEGQRVEIDYAAGTVSVDGVVLDEDYMLEPMVQQSWQGITTLTVPEGCVFVMGDNRNISDDSRDGALGAVEESYLLGKVELVLFPFANFGPIS